LEAFKQSVPHFKDSVKTIFLTKLNMIKRGLRFSNNTQMKEKKVSRVGNGEWTAGEWNCAIFH